MNLSDYGRTNEFMVGGDADVKLSQSDYWHMQIFLKCQSFSPEGFIKMKNLADIFWGTCIAVSIQAVPVAYLGTQLVVGNIRRSHSGYK